MPFINELDPTTPQDTDSAGDGNEQIQALKSTLKDQFPNLTGGTGDVGVTATTDQLNEMSDYDTAKQTVEQRLAALEAGGGGGASGVPVGTIAMWSDIPNGPGIPAGWYPCDGGTYNSRTTPDLRNRFIVGAGDWYTQDDAPATAETSALGFYVQATDERGDHNHGGTLPHLLTINEMPQHDHSLFTAFTLPNSGGTQVGTGRDSTGNGTQTTDPRGGSQPHTHGMDFDGAHQHLYGFEPHRHALIFIMYLGAP